MLKNLTPEELELMSYTDISYAILKESKKPIDTPTLLKEILKLLELNEDSYVDKIGDYYTSLTMDKRFVLVENNEWDIRDKHSVEIVLDEDEDETEEIEEEIEIEEDEMEPEEESEDTLYDDESEIDDDDDMDDLPILDDEELEEE